ncbi:MAG TPA: hypothetical protein VGD76_02390 [Ramlibacter sp.]
MNLTSSPRFLSTVLWVDAASCLATGALQLAAPATLSAWFGLPASLLTTTGWMLLAVAAFAALAARSPRPPLVWVMVLGNAAWLVGCVELLLTGAAGTALGVAWVVLQALVVGVLGELEWLGLKRAPAAAMA